MQVDDFSQYTDEEMRELEGATWDKYEYGAYKPTELVHTEQWGDLRLVTREPVIGAYSVAESGAECAERSRTEYDGVTDSREKLEADAQSTANAIYLMAYDDGVAQSGRDGEPARVGTQWITELLDRQAAITERECREYEDELREQHHKRVGKLEAELRDCDENRIMFRDQRDYAEERIAELEAERSKAIKARAELFDQCAAVTAERDYYKRVAQMQADSFKKLEADLALARSESDAKEETYGDRCTDRCPGDAVGRVAGHGGSRCGEGMQAMTEFETGARRDTGGKGRCDLLPHAALLRVAHHMEDALEDHEERNWEKGIPMHSFLDSAMRHLFKYMDGWIDEDHLAAAASNVLMAMWTEDHLPEMQDIPARAGEYEMREQLTVFDTVSES